MDIRRSMLFLPGNNPGMLQNGGVFGADSVILDLEDAVAPSQKNAARLLVANALKNVDYCHSEKVVRINPLDTYGREDIPVIVPCSPDALLVPKVEKREDVIEVAKLVSKAEVPGQKPVKLIALIETPKGIVNVDEIAAAGGRLIALALGAEDYTAALGTTRTKEGMEISHARMCLINAAAAFGIQSIDTPFTDANDNEGLVQDTIMAKKLGFKGKLCINPRQIEAVHKVFNPGQKDIDWALLIVEAINRAKAEGSGVASIGGKMVDAPVVNRAERVLYLARQLGLLKEAVK